MKIKRVSHISCEPTRVYDVINSEPYHNFFIKTKESCVVSHNCAIMDEVSFAPGQNVHYESTRIMDVYTNIRRRMDSRFMVQGRNYGLMFLVSSKATESSFLEAYIADQVKKGYPIYVVDQPLWKVKPAAYSGKMFKVAVGNKYLPSRIVIGDSEENIKEQCELYKKQGLNIIDVPIEHKQAFDQNIEKALQDIAGISTSVVTKAFSMPKIQACISDTYENPFTTEIVTLGTHDGLRLQDFFDVRKIPDSVKGSPIFIHLDASVSGDRTGLSGTAIIGTKQKITYGANVEEESISEELIMQQVFSVGIQAPSDSEISFEKTRQFIYYLHDEVGLNIKMVSTDGFQCLHKDSLIRTTKGLKPLQEILSDDILYSYWGDVDKSVETTIKKKQWTRFDTRSVLIKTSDGDLRTTLDHQILINDSYVQAQDLSKYSLIRKKTGDYPEEERFRDKLVPQLGMSASNFNYYLRTYNLRKYLRNQKGSSQAELEIGDIIESWGFQVIRRTRKIIPPYEIDIYLPDLKFGIEYNGSYWHKDSADYDQMKIDLCKEIGVTLIDISEEDYIKDKDSVILSLFSMLGLDQEFSLVLDTEIQDHPLEEFGDIEVNNESHNLLTNIGYVHNSVDTRQILDTKGYPTGYTSLDRTPDGYDGLRSAIADKRIILLKGCEVLHNELTELERDNMTRKYDHPVGGTKDIADSFAGSVMDAMKYKDEYIFFNPSDIEYEDINSNKSDQEEYLENFRDSLIRNFEENQSNKKRSDPRVLEDLDEIDIFGSYSNNSNILEW